MFLSVICQLGILLEQCTAGPPCPNVQVFIKDKNTDPNLGWVLSGTDGLLAQFQSVARPKGALIPVSLKFEAPHMCAGRTYNVFLRAHTSDFGVMVQHFCQCELCGLAQLFPSAKLARKGVGSSFHPQSSVTFDLGGNVGMATLAMACVFPHDRIVTVEPGLSNFVTASVNTMQLFNQVHLEYGGIWSHQTFLTPNGTVSSLTPTVGYPEASHMSCKWPSLAVSF